VQFFRPPSHAIPVGKAMPGDRIGDILADAVLTIIDYDFDGERHLPRATCMNDHFPSRANGASQDVRDVMHVPERAERVHPETNAEVTILVVSTRKCSRHRQEHRPVTHCREA
jgi:hypothetical protein